MTWWVFLGIYPAWGFLSFIDLWFNIFYYFLKILSQYVIKYFFSLILFLLSFRDSSYMYDTMFDIVLQLLDTLFFFLPSLFLLV